MCKLFDEWSNEIQSFCDENQLSFEAAKNLSQAWNKNTVVLYFCDKHNNSDGLMNDTPSPMVLLIRREKDGRITFEQTEHTQKYLRKVS